MIYSLIVKGRTTIVHTDAIPRIGETITTDEGIFTVVNVTHRVYPYTNFEGKNRVGSVPDVYTEKA